MKRTEVVGTLVRPDSMAEVPLERSRTWFDVEQLWLDEAARRYESYRRGDISSRPAAEVFARARARLPDVNRRFLDPAEQEMLDRR